MNIRAAIQNLHSFQTRKRRCIGIFSALEKPKQSLHIRGSGWRPPMRFFHRHGERLPSPAIRAWTASSDVISGERRARATGVLSASENPSLFSPLRIFRSVFSPCCTLSGHTRWVGGGSRDQRMIRKKRTRCQKQQKWMADEDPKLIRQELHPNSPENTVSPWVVKQSLWKVPPHLEYNCFSSIEIQRHHFFDLTKKELHEIGNKNKGETTGEGEGG